MRRSMAATVEIQSESFLALTFLFYYHCYYYICFYLPFAGTRCGSSLLSLFPSPFFLFLPVSLYISCFNAHCHIHIIFTITRSVASARFFLFVICYIVFGSVVGVAILVGLRRCVRKKEKN